MLCWYEAIKLWVLISKGESITICYYDPNEKTYLFEFLGDWSIDSDASKDDYSSSDYGTMWISDCGLLWGSS